MPARSTEVTSAPRRYAALDALRFLAAFAVLGYHFTAREHDYWGMKPWEAFPELAWFTAYGAYGVDLFFIISGFVILMSAWDRGLPSFAASRIGRLYPGYWAGVLLTSLLLGVLWPGQREVTFPQTLVNLTMMQEAVGVDNIDAVYWTLWTELRFYILIGVFILIGITTRRVIAFAALWPPLAIMANRAELSWIGDVFIANQAPLFAGGMMLYLLVRNPRSIIAWLVLAENVVLAAGYASKFSASRIEESTNTVPTELTQALVLIGCFVLVALTVFGPLSRSRAAFLTFAGALTYPLYLTHEYWGWWMIHLVSGSVPLYVGLLIATVFSLALAWAIYQFVEKPLGPRLRRAVQQSLTRSDDRAPE